MSPTAKTAVIVGGGVAGTSCALNLSTLVPNVHIVLIDPGPSIKLCNELTHLSHTTLDTSVTEAEAKSWCDRHNISFRRAYAIGLTHEHVYLSTGESINFNVCCLATGARPFLPKPLRDQTLAPHIFTLRDTESVVRLTSRLGSCRRIVVVGGGGIGMEVVYELDGCDIVWIVKESHIGATFFDQRIVDCIQSLPKPLSSRNTHSNKAFVISESEISKQDSPNVISAAAVGPHWLRQREGPTFFGNNVPFNQTLKPQNECRLQGSASSRSLKILASCEISSLEADKSGEWRLLVRLTNEDTVPCDAIIAGAGVVPNMEWTQVSIATPHYTFKETVNLHSGDGGVVVTAGNMEASIPGVFAAGDCTHVAPISGTDWVQMRTWGQALTGGRAAASAMASRLGIEDNGTGLEFEVFAHATQFFGHRVVLLGRWRAQGLTTGFRLLERSNKHTFVRVVLVDGRVRGAVLIGNTENAEVFENLIVSQMDVGWLGESLVDEDFELDNYFD